MGNEKMPMSLNFTPDATTHPKICEWHIVMEPKYEKVKLPKINQPKIDHANKIIWFSGVPTAGKSFCAD